MALLDLLLSKFFSLNPLTIMLIGWTLMPGGMFIAAYIGESRILHIGTGQSRMFFPGDFAIGIMLSQLGRLYQQGASTSQIWSHSAIWLLAAIGIPFAVFILQRLITDAPRYAPRARISPTKLYHDIVGYIICIFLVASRLVPELVHLFTHWARSWKQSRGEWIIIFLASGFYLGCAAYDALVPKRAPGLAQDTNPEKSLMEQRHPSDWQPIWQTRKTG